ncbi:MAG: carboxypeptidase regulatory-like domain-containing protein [Pyrinomonadaceae bacterium]
MKSILCTFALVFAILSFSAKASSAELIVNGGFETGNFSGWTAVNPANGWINWLVSGAGHGGGFAPPNAVTPAQGNFSAWQGVSVFQPGGGTYTLSQDVVLPAAQSASFFWQDRFQSNLTSFCGFSGAPVCGTQTYRVQILNTSNVVLQTIHTVVNNPGQNLDTGWRGHVFILTPYAGQTIRIRFSTVATGNTDGPGQIDIDSVSIQSPQSPTSANVSVSGRVMTNEGQGITRAIITLTNAAGISRSAMSNQFGYYRLDEVRVGETYTVSVNSKKYFFADSPRVVTVNDELTNLNFTASP